MEEEQSKRIEEPLDHLNYVKERQLGGAGAMGAAGTDRVVAGLQKVVEALKMHAELVALLAKSNEKLVQSNEQLLHSSATTERWTKAVGMLTFALVALTFVLLFFTSVQALAGVGERLPGWGRNVLLIVFPAGLLAATVLIFAVMNYWVKAQRTVFPKNRD